VSYLRTFLPWIVYAVLAGHTAAAQQRGTLAALAVTVLVIAYKVRKEHSAFDALIIETGSAVFFAAMAAVAFAAPHSGVLTYAAALASATLAVIAWASLAARHPFTLGIAKQTAPREVWSQPAFMHSNVVITMIWAYKGMDAEEFEKRITTFSEYGLSGNVSDVKKIYRHLTTELGFDAVGFSPATASTDRLYSIGPQKMDSVLGGFAELAMEYRDHAIEGRQHGFSNVSDTLKELHSGISKAYPCGAGLGLLGAWILPHFISDPIAISPVATAGAIVVAVGIGVVFGVYPASRAAKLPPIDALRSE